MQEKKKLTHRWYGEPTHTSVLGNKWVWSVGNNVDMGAKIE